MSTRYYRPARGREEYLKLRAGQAVVIRRLPPRDCRDKGETTIRVEFSDGLLAQVRPDELRKSKVRKAPKAEGRKYWPPEALFDHHWDQTDPRYWFGKEKA